MSKKKKLKHLGLLGKRVIFKIDESHVTGRMVEIIGDMCTLKEVTGRNPNDTYIRPLNEVWKL